jgi:AcrR family transcriptional regulator
MTAPSPRKQPLQERSKATVDAILAAAGQVLAREGLARATTHRIAERAGVSVGTLYQYFPNKQSILAALITRHAEAAVSGVLSWQQKLATMSVADASRALVHQVLDGFRGDPLVLRALLVHRDQLVSEHERSARQAFLQQLVARPLQLRRAEVLVQDIELAAFILVKTTESLVAAALLERPQSLQDGSLENELVALCCRYLGGHEPSSQYIPSNPRPEADNHVDQ